MASALIPSAAPTPSRPTDESRCQEKERAGLRDGGGGRFGYRGDVEGGSVGGEVEEVSAREGVTRVPLPLRRKAPVLTVPTGAVRSQVSWKRPWVSVTKGTVTLCPGRGREVEEAQGRAVRKGSVLSPLSESQASVSRFVMV